MDIYKEICIINIIMSNNLFKISNEKDLVEVLTNVQGRLITLMFSARWCGPCRTLKPKFVELSKIHQQSLFIYVDIDVYNDVNYSFLDKVEGIPKFMFFINNQVFEEFEGAEYKKLKQTVEQGEAYINQQGNIQQKNSNSQFQ